MSALGGESADFCLLRGFTLSHLCRVVSGEVSFCRFNKTTQWVSVNLSDGVQLETTRRILWGWKYLTERLSGVWGHLWGVHWDFGWLWLVSCLANHLEGERASERETGTSGCQRWCHHYYRDITVCVCVCVFRCQLSAVRWLLLTCDLTAGSQPIRRQRRFGLCFVKGLCVCACVCLCVCVLDALFMYSCMYRCSITDSSHDSESVHKRQESVFLIFISDVMTEQKRQNCEVCAAPGQFTALTRYSSVSLTLTERSSSQH